MSDMIFRSNVSFSYTFVNEISSTFFRQSYKTLHWQGHIHKETGDAIKTVNNWLTYRKFMKW
jgi:hypothetical protein